MKKLLQNVWVVKFNRARMFSQTVKKSIEISTPFIDFILINSLHKSKFYFSQKFYTKLANFYLLMKRNSVVTSKKDIACLFLMFHSNVLILCSSRINYWHQLSYFFSLLKIMQKSQILKIFITHADIFCPPYLTEVDDCQILNIAQKLNSLHHRIIFLLLTNSLPFTLGIPNEKITVCKRGHLLDLFMCVFG